jgi:hypothetical protein
MFARGERLITTGSTNMRPPSSCPIQPYAPIVLTILTINRFNEIKSSAARSGENKAAIYLPLRFSAGKEQKLESLQVLWLSRFPENSKHPAKFPAVCTARTVCWFRILHCCKKLLDSINGFITTPPVTPIQIKRSQNDGAQSEDEARELMDIIVTPAAYCLSTNN